MPEITTVYEPMTNCRVEKHKYAPDSKNSMCIYVVFFNNQEIRSWTKKRDAVATLDALIENHNA